MTAIQHRFADTNSLCMHVAEATDFRYAPIAVITLADVGFFYYMLVASIQICSNGGDIPRFGIAFL